LQALEAREQPVSDWYKDEGGRGNVLRFTVGAPVRLTERVRLGAQLMYEDGSLVEDAEETLTMVTQPGAMALTPEMPEVTIEFRIEKVSRRKDGRRFCLQVAPMYDPGPLRPRDGFFAPIVSQPINVLSKRKPGEREVTRVQRRPMVDAPDDSAAHFKMLHGTMLQLQKTVDEVKALEKRNAKRLDMLTAFITSGGGSTAPAGLLMQLGSQLPRDDSSASTGSALGGRGVRGAGMGGSAGAPLGVPPMLRSDSLGDLPLSNYGAAPITSWDLGNGANPASSASGPAAEGSAGAGDGPGASSGGKPSRGRHGTGASDSKTAGDGDALAGAGADAAAPRTGGRGKRGAKAGAAAASAAAPGAAAAGADGIDGGADVSLPGSLRPALLPGLSMASDAGDAAEGASGGAAGDSAASSSGSVGSAGPQSGAAAAGGGSSSMPLLGGLSAASGLLMMGPGGSQLHRGISMGGAFDDVIAQGAAGGAPGPGFPFGSLPLPGGHPSLARGLSRQISVGDPVSLMEALYRDGEGALMGAGGYGGQPGKETPRTASIMGMTHHLQSPLGQMGARAGAGASVPGANASSDMGGGISSVATGMAPKEGSGAAPKRAKVEMSHQ
jgi:hypothetical protein